MTDMAGRIAAVVDGGRCDVGVESTVADLTPAGTGGPIRLLRPGGVTVPMLEKIAGRWRWTPLLPTVWRQAPWPLPQA